MLKHEINQLLITKFIFIKTQVFIRLNVFTQQGAHCNPHI
uniref:Uncharacterized protein n=1 Tax=Klebsiella pneumoniae TaxID=573 RepID=A0A486TY14_KLEPN|nr:Uncharacterised protein [Klebsiella pneumoniae]